jgi:hypothetical protein
MYSIHFSSSSLLSVSQKKPKILEPTQFLKLFKKPHILISLQFLRTFSKEHTKLVIDSCLTSNKSASEHKIIQSEAWIPQIIQHSHAESVKPKQSPTLMKKNALSLQPEKWKNIHWIEVRKEDIGSIFFWHYILLSFYIYNSQIYQTFYIGPNSSLQNRLGRWRLSLINPCPGQLTFDVGFINTLSRPIFILSLTHPYKTGL